MPNHSESVLNEPNVVSLPDRRRTLQQGRVEQILAALENARTFPADLYEEDASGDLVAAPGDWAYFERIFEAFQLQLPRDLNAKAALGSVVYLAGHLGSKIKLRATNEAVYQRVQSTLSAAERDYIEALFSDDVHRSSLLIKNLGVLRKLPTDFA